MFELSNLQLAAWILYLGTLGWLLKQFPPTQMLASKRMQHLVLGGAVFSFILWSFQVGVLNGLEVHFLGLTALSLMLGFRRALFAGSLALLGVTLIGEESWSMLGVNGLLGVLLPLGISHLVYNLSFHKLPRHFFVYIFVCAFLTGALCIALKMLLMGGYFYLDGLYSWREIKDNYLMLIVLLIFPEGMFNGMSMTLLVIYAPSWVYSFYDKFYLDGK